MKWREKAIDILSVTMAGAALFVSMCTKEGSERAHRDTQTEEAVSRTYQAFAEMNKLQVEHPEVAHLLTNADDYDETVELVRLSIGPLTDQERAKYILIEDGAAFSIFSEVDRLVIARHAAAKIGEKERAAFIDQTLDFYSRTILRNPRLAFYWLEDGAQAYYDPATIEFFSQRVWRTGDGSKAVRIDKLGPILTATKPSEPKENVAKMGGTPSGE